MIEVGDLVRVQSEYRTIQDADDRCWLVVETDTHVWLEAALCAQGNRRRWFAISLLEKV
jgi:hypothetical protein